MLQSIHVISNYIIEFQTTINKSEINIGKHIDLMGSKAMFVLVSGMENCEVIGSLVNMFMLG